MKRLASLLLSVLLLCALSGPAFAAEEEMTTYEIPDLGITLKLPAHYDVFTRDMAKDDPAFASQGLTYREVMRELKGYHYLKALPKPGNPSCDISLSMSPVAYDDLKKLDDAALQKYAASTASIIKEVYSFVPLQSFYEHPQALFLCSAYESETTGANYLEYITVQNGLQFTVLLSADIFTPEDLLAAQQLIDSMEFGELPLSTKLLRAASAPWVEILLVFLLLLGICVALALLTGRKYFPFRTRDDWVAWHQRRSLLYNIWLVLKDLFS